MKNRKVNSEARQISESSESTLIKRFLEFVCLLTSSDHISKAEIEQKLNIKDSAFYKYLANARKYFKIDYVGTIGGNAYYSIDKESFKKYFSL